MLVNGGHTTVSARVSPAARASSLTNEAASAAPLFIFQLPAMIGMRIPGLLVGSRQQSVESRLRTRTRVSQEGHQGGLSADFADFTEGGGNASQEPSGKPVRILVAKGVAEQARHSSKTRSVRFT